MVYKASRDILYSFVGEDSFGSQRSRSNGMTPPSGGTAPLKPTQVASPMTWFTKRPGTSFTVSLEKTGPAASDRRSLAAEVEFPHQAPAVIHQNPVLQGHQLDPLATQSSADQPVFSLQLDFSVTVHFEHP